MKAWRLWLVCGWVLPALCAGAEVRELSLSPAPDMTRAHLHVWEGEKRPRAVLVLCPGHNGSGEGLVKDRAWQKFAHENRLGLVGLSYASEGPLLQRGRGYYYPEQGSGALLLQGVQEAFGKGLPLLLYGFSGGAHFTSRFAAWKPERVRAWCAYSAAWWDEPQGQTQAPPGIVACGDADASRLGASLIYFKQGRAQGRPWLWVGLRGQDHAPSPALEAFVRAYFASVLKLAGLGDGQWVDVDRGEPITAAAARAEPSVSGWLPAADLLTLWTEVHAP